MNVEVESSLEVGVHKVNITLTDDNVEPEESNYQLVIIITESSHADALLAKSNLETYEVVKTQPSKLARTPISSMSIDHLGLLTINFSEEMSLLDED